MEKYLKMRERENRNPSSRWNGEERRSCLQHARHEEKFAGVESRITEIEELRPISISLFKWAIGLTVSAILSLFSVSVYIAQHANEKLHIIEVKQETTITKLEQVRTELKTMKTIHHAEMDAMKRRLDTRAVIFEELIKQLKLQDHVNTKLKMD